MIMVMSAYANLTRFCNLFHFWHIHLHMYVYHVYGRFDTFEPSFLIYIYAFNKLAWFCCFENDQSDWHPYLSGALFDTAKEISVPYHDDIRIPI